MDVYDFPASYRGVTFNSHRTSAGVLIPNSEVDIYRLTVMDFSRLQQRDQREPLHLLPGGDLGDATLPFRYLSLAGMIKASNGARLDDMIAVLERSFDVEEAQRDFPSTEGVTNFDFTGMSEVNNGRGTAFTDEHGVGGQFYVPERFLARPAAYAIVTGRRSGGNSANFAAELVCGDRRRYCQTAESVVLNSGNGFAANAANWSTDIGIAVPPTITIVTTGAGSATLTITITGSAGPLVLDFSAETSGTFVIDCAAGTIKKGSTHKAYMRTSDVTTIFMTIRGNASTPISVTNTTNVTSVTVAYRQARG